MRRYLVLFAIVSLFCTAAFVGGASPASAAQPERQLVATGGGVGNLAPLPMIGIAHVFACDAFASGPALVSIRLTSCSIDGSDDMPPAGTYGNVVEQSSGDAHWTGFWIDNSFQTQVCWTAEAVFDNLTVNSATDASVKLLVLPAETIHTSGCRLI